MPQDIVTFALSFAIVLAAGLLGAGIGGDEKSPVVVRHRSAVIRERTLIPVFGLAMLSLGMVRATRQDRCCAAVETSFARSCHVWRARRDGTRMTSDRSISTEMAEQSR